MMAAGGFYAWVSALGARIGHWFWHRNLHGIMNPDCKACERLKVYLDKRLGSSVVCNGTYIEHDTFPLSYAYPF